MKKQKQVNWKVVVTALVCVTILEAIALFKGIDGVLLTAVIAAILGAAGFILPSPLKLK